MKIPAYVKKILQTLQDNGYTAYAVGGAVRDSLLGRKPQDWDVATDALPERVIEIFPRTVPTGLKHGTVTVLQEAGTVEVTTFRADGDYTDFRHPDGVRFSSDITEDLARRDFTVNAMAYNGELIDPYGGREDLHRGILRCVGEPDKRFTEDPLRILRGVRFAACRNLTVETETLSAMERLAPLLEHVSRERIWQELRVLLCEAQDLSLLRIVLPAILPELAAADGVAQNHPHHCYDVLTHILKVTEAAPPDITVKLAALLHDIGKPTMRRSDPEKDHFKGHSFVSAVMAEGILHRLRVPKRMLKEVLTLIRWHDSRFHAEERVLRHLMATLGKSVMQRLIVLQRADAMGQSDYLREQKLERADRVETLLKKIIEEKQPLAIGDLAVSGGELEELGLQGKEIGRLLRHLLVCVLDDPSRNRRDELLAEARRWKI